MSDLNKFKKYKERRTGAVIKDLSKGVKNTAKTAKTLEKMLAPTKKKSSKFSYQNKEYVKAASLEHEYRGEDGPMIIKPHSKLSDYENSVMDMYIEEIVSCKEIIEVSCDVYEVKCCLDTIIEKYELLSTYEKVDLKSKGLTLRNIKKEIEFYKKVYDKYLEEAAVRDDAMQEEK